MEAVRDIAAPERSAAEFAPWWTDADRAELAVLVRALVDGIADHRTACMSCARPYPPCPHIRKAIEVVTDWHRARDLLSHARWLRWERELLEFRRDQAAFRRSG